MSLLVKDMKMPKNCNECPMYFYEGQGICSCRVLSAIEDDEVLKPWKKKRKDCPLIEIPDKHGRLIDADTAYEQFLNLMDIQGTINPCQLGTILVDAPTIINAKDGET